MIRLQSATSACDDGPDARPVSEASTSPWTGPSRLDDLQRVNVDALAEFLDPDDLRPREVLSGM